MGWNIKDPSLGNDPAYLTPRIVTLEKDKIDKSEKGLSIATLGIDGKVPLDQLPEIETGGVKSVNSNLPDENGDAKLTKSDLDLGDVDNEKQATKLEFDNHKLVIASPTDLGHVKVGTNLTIDADGKLNAEAGGGVLEPYIRAVLLAGWKNPTGTWSGAPLSYFKDSDGVVHLKGVVERTTGGTNVYFELPIGYRPVRTEYHIIVRREVNTETFWSGSIGTDGRSGSQSNDGGLILFDVSFRTS